MRAPSFDIDMNILLKIAIYLAYFGWYCVTYSLFKIYITVHQPRPFGNLN